MPPRAKTDPNLPPFRLVAPASLTPYKNNPRTHPPAQIEAIKRSIREFGFTLPVLVGPDGVILAGHGRVLAALALGMDEVPVIELAHLTPAQRRAYVIADNQIAQQSGWDEGLLKLELGDLRMEGFDLSLTGFTDLQITGFLAGRNEGQTDPDAVPDPQPVVVSRAGDIWLLGATVTCPHCRAEQTPIPTPKGK